MFATVRHLSIICNSMYHMEDQTGNIVHSEKFEETLRNTVASVGKLRSLVLLGRYDSFLFQSFQTAFQKAHNLCLLHLSSTSADFHPFMCNLVNSTHLRYLKLEVGHAGQEALTQVLRKCFHLEVLDVNQYNDTRLATSWTVRQDNSGERQILPSLESFQFLRRLKLSKMQHVREVLVPSLEELVLVEMPELKTCSCTCVGDLKSSLRVLEVQSCPALEVFDLFQNGSNYQTEHNSWLPRLRKLIICDCPNLHVLIPLRPSATFCELLIRGVPTMKGSSNQTLEIKPNSVLVGSPGEIMALDDKFLAFHNMRDLKYLGIKECWNLASILVRTFGHLISLRSLRIESCKELFLIDDALYALTSNDDALPCLESLSIKSCGITGKWLSLMLRHALALKELSLDGCPELTHLQFKEKGNIQSNLMISAMESLSSEYQDYPSTNSSPDGLWRIPLSLTSSLEKITICECRHLVFNGSREGFAGFTSLKELTIQACPELLTSLVHNDGEVNGRWFLSQSLGRLKINDYPQDTLRPCFVGNLTCLEILEISNSPCLKSLQLDSCTAMKYLDIGSCEWLAELEGMQSLGILTDLKLKRNSSLESVQLHSCTSLHELEIYYCWSLVALEGVQSLVNLKDLTVCSSPALDSLTTSGESCEQIEGISSDSYELFELFPALEYLWINNLSPLATSFCKGLTCLRRLEIVCVKEATGLTNEQVSALLLLRSLQNLQFKGCLDLVRLPAGLQSFPSLKKLKIEYCGITSLPKEGLPSSLEKLVIKDCTDELSMQCRSLVTSKLKVKIDGLYVN